ncbi:MAG: hypothetical protein ACK40G_03230 [Cytophagaceae bacterium]
MSRDVPSIIFATLYLLIFTIAPYVGVKEHVILLMFSLSPLVIIYMVIKILKDGKPPVKTLAKGEEWGYCDISREELNKRKRF